MSLCPKFNRQSWVKLLQLFFSVQEDNLKREWEEALSISFNENDILCEAHFKRKDLQEFFETPMPDRTIHPIRRGQVSLRQNAIPVKVCWFIKVRSWLNIWVLVDLWKFSNLSHIFHKMHEQILIIFFLCAYKFVMNEYILRIYNSKNSRSTGSWNTDQDVSREGVSYFEVLRNLNTYECIMFTTLIAKY